MHSLWHCVHIWKLPDTRCQEILYCVLDREEQPDHPNKEEVMEKVQASVKEWKCAKWTREEGPLPLGPMSVKK